MVYSCTSRLAERNTLIGNKSLLSSFNKLTHFYYAKILQNSTSYKGAQWISTKI